MNWPAAPAQFRPAPSALWIITAAGQEFDLEQLRLGQVDIKSIAHSLAQLNRFTGHASRPYSVAEHSLLVADIAERELGLDVHGQLAALLHDAHEAYCGDLHTPGKRRIGAAWYSFERQLEGLVHSAFAINSAARHHEAAIKRADLMALAIERRDLLPATASSWAALSGVPCLARVDLQCPERASATWADWRQQFLQRYQALDFARNQALFGCSRHAPAEPINL